MLSRNRPEAVEPFMIHHVGTEHAASIDVMEDIMNWDQIEGNWKQFKGQAQERWGELTNDELDEAAGRRQQLVGKLQERYGYAKEEAEREADEFARQV